MLAGSWGTQLAVPPSMCCSMAMLALPAEITLKTKLEADGLRNLLRSQYKVEIPICTTGSAAFVRLSHQVYNTAEDYRALGDAVLQIVKQIKNGESLEEMLEGHITYDWNMSALKIF